MKLFLCLSIVFFLCIKSVFCNFNIYNNDTEENFNIYNNDTEENFNIYNNDTEENFNIYNKDTEENFNIYNNDTEENFNCEIMSCNITQTPKQFYFRHIRYTYNYTYYLKVVIFNQTDYLISSDVFNEYMGHCLDHTIYLNTPLLPENKYITCYYKN